MSYRVLITPRALADLREIRDYIARRSPANAAKFLQRLLREIDRLEEIPESFALAPEDKFVPYPLRQVVVRPYRILYRVSGRAVEILHVRHGARKRARPEELT